MKRKIVGFYQDEENDWVAELECFHKQHVRHNPPFFNRPWTASSEGRESMLGQALECGRCSQLEWPENLESLRCTPEFDQNSIPTRLMKDHTTKSGVWGMIHVTSGKLRYVCQAPVKSEVVLEPEIKGVIPPNLPHHIEAMGLVNFYVEFFTRHASKN